MVQDSDDKNTITSLNSIITTMNDRQRLQQRLAQILGFDEGLEDALDHLLTIESVEDLSDYLSQLLGASNAKPMEMLVQEIGKFQRDEPLLPLDVETQDEVTNEMTKVGDNHGSLTITPSLSTTAATPSNPPKHTSAASKKSPPKQKQKLDQPSSGSISKPSPNQQPPSGKKVKTKNNKKSIKNPPNQQQQEETLSYEQVLNSLTAKQGDIKTICGCFGVQHLSTKNAAVTNCVICGRVSCSREVSAGNTACPFCHSLLLLNSKPSHRRACATEQAWTLQEQMLQRDRQKQATTKVLNDQGDYYTSSNSEWATEQQRQTAQKQEEERIQKLHTRQSMQLQLDVQV